MLKVRLSYLLIIVCVAATLVLSLFLVFAQSKEIALMSSTGLGLLGLSGEAFNQVNQATGGVTVGGASFFKNFVGAGAEGFAIIGIVITVFYWIFLVTGLAAIVFTLYAMIVNPRRQALALRLVDFQASLGLILVGLAVVIVIYCMLSQLNQAFSTQYLFLLIPILLTFFAVRLLRKELRKSSRKAAEKKAESLQNQQANS
ncbi:MAG: hypothetical protein FWD27_07660 [Coriobacteriia bacterium]|nr:hypothetical protein [Coriobacteriia bacterium]